MSKLCKHIKKWRYIWLSAFVGSVLLCVNFSIHLFLTETFIANFTNTSLTVISILFGFTLASYTLVISLFSSEVYTILKAMKKYETVLRPFRFVLVGHIITLTIGLLLASIDRSSLPSIILAIISSLYLLFVIYSIIASYSLIHELLNVKKIVEDCKTHYRQLKNH